MSDTISKRQLLSCSPVDPCNYDNTCANHKLFAELERELSACRAELEANRNGCPCAVEGIEPCNSSCSCANSIMSGGCSRCARYGSREQRLKAAQSLVFRLASRDSSEKEEWASQFTCPKCGPCTYAIVTTKKTCLNCDSLLIRHAPFPALDCQAEGLADEIEFLEGVSQQAMWNGRARDKFRNIIIALRSRQAPRGEADGERWRTCLQFGFPVRNQTAHNKDVLWTINGKWFGATAELCIDAARAHPQSGESDGGRG